MKNVLRSIGIAMIFIGIMFLVICHDNLLIRIKRPIDLYAEDYSIEELSSGDYLNVEVYALFECYAVNDWYTEENNRKTYTDHDYFYSIPVFDAEEPESTYYISIKADKKHRSKFESIVDDTYDFLMGQESDFGQNVVTGVYRVSTLDDELYQFMKEYFVELGDEEEMVDKYVLPYNLIPVNTENEIGVVIGFGLFLGGIFFFVTMSVLLKGEKKKAKEQTHVVINGVTYPKSAFDHMFQDALCQNERAISELCSITGITTQEAKKIIKHWDKYYYY